MREIVRKKGAFASIPYRRAWHRGCVGLSRTMLYVKLKKYGIAPLRM